jgi:hypothetical protein
VDDADHSRDNREDIRGRRYVICHVCNDRPFLPIPYEYEGSQHHYEPDYIVKLMKGSMVLLEMKGGELDQDHTK